MRRLMNKKGTILVATYMVLCVIIVVASSFFSMVLTDNKAVTRDNDGVRALSNAERGIAYAYYEAYNLGWDWTTHKWFNTNKTKLKVVPPGQRMKTRADCDFNGDGFYVHASGDFMVKAYPDQTRDNDIVVVVRGICGNETKTLMYYLTRRGIYDFFLYTPYDLDLYNAVGRHPKLNGGGIHSNGDIHIDTYMRLEDISELSAGEDGNIYYEGRQYIPPYFADRLDGVMDGKSPITRLDDMGNVWRDDTVNEAGPFGNYNSSGQWCWDSGATYFVGTSLELRDSFQSTELHFAGSKQDIHNVAPGQSSYVVNDSSVALNSQNCWIKPYILDSEGDRIEKTWVEIPSEMDTEWEWDKYGWSSYGSVSGEKPVSFYTYKDDGTSVDVANTYWEIDGGTGDVVMLDPPIGGDVTQWAVFNAAHPSAQKYWDMYASPEFWKSTYDDNSYYEYLAEVVNPEVLDGTYGDERLNGDALMVKHTNSKKQPDDWRNYLVNSGLDGIVRDGNNGGEYLEPPDFDQTYSRLAERDGLLIDLDSSFDGSYDDYDEWQDVLEKSIDNAVATLNYGTTTNDVAKKVKFINTFTGKWNVVLEIDFKNMQTQSKYPNNGIVYSKVPIRITNASKLARAKPKYGFTLLGEENVYLKGDYNVDQWVTSAVISKKRIFTLSDNFNDPQVKPALEHYPDYPYLYVKDDNGTYVEVPKGTSGGTWVSSYYLDSDGAVDMVDYYAGINDGNEAALRATISEKEADYRSVFNKPDPTGFAEDTWTWAGTGESYTSGMMVNKVEQGHTYNALMASYRFMGSGQCSKGDILENWTSNSKSRTLNGAFFILESSSAGGFTADNDEFVDYYSSSGLYYDHRCSSHYVWYMPSTNAAESLSYDEQFRTATRSPSDVFFGGAESLWAETTEDFFFQLDF